MLQVEYFMKRCKFEENKFDCFVSFSHMSCRRLGCCISLLCCLYKRLILLINLIMKERIDRGPIKCTQNEETSKGQNFFLLYQTWHFERYMNVIIYSLLSLLAHNFGSAFSFTFSLGFLSLLQNHCETFTCVCLYMQ